MNLNSNSFYIFVIVTNSREHGYLWAIDERGPPNPKVLDGHPHHLSNAVSDYYCRLRILLAVVLCGLLTQFVHILSD